MKQCVSSPSTYLCVYVCVVGNWHNYKTSKLQWIEEASNNTKKLQVNRTKRLQKVNKVFKNLNSFEIHVYKKSSICSWKCIVLKLYEFIKIIAK